MQFIIGFDIKSLSRRIFFKHAVSTLQTKVLIIYALTRDKSGNFKQTD